MTIHTTRVNVEEFERIVQRPENKDRRLELIGGEIFEVVSNNYASAVAAQIIFLIKLHMREHGIGGTVTGADGGYQVAGERYIPDVAFVSAERQPQPSKDAYNPLAPDLAVEVLSPSDDPAQLRFKLTNYLAAGTVVWVVDPDARQVEIHAPGQPAQRLTGDDTLSGGDTLPGFAANVADVFPA